ncbi:hypothetical protein AAG906_005942 [Vitis piasezkii]
MDPANRECLTSQAAPDVKYLEKVERRSDPDMRYPDEVERRPDRISDVIHPGGVSYATRRKGAVRVAKEKGATWHFLVRIPHLLP